MMTSDLIRTVRRLEIRARRAMSSGLLGRYVSVFKGRGMAFEEVREYVPGDDIRLLDWNVTARVGTPHIKVFREERELVVTVVIDVSASQAFGSAGKLKGELARELAALISCAALTSNDRVGLLLFSGQVDEYIRPRSGRGHLWRILQRLSSEPFAGRGSDLGAALRLLTKVQKRRSLVVVISDFQTTGYEQALRAVAARNEVICLRTFDASERELPRVGLVAFEDSEQGEWLLIDTDDPVLRLEMSRRAAQQETELARLCAKCGADYLSVATSADALKTLGSFLSTRQRRRAGEG